MLSASVISVVNCCLCLFWSVAVQMHDMENQIAIANRRAAEAENRVCTAAVL